MSRLIHLSPARKPALYLAEPPIIADQSLTSDTIRLANMYHMAFPNETLEMEINSWNSLVDNALSFFCMIEDQHFPLEHMWEWDDALHNYEGTIRPWLMQVPVKVLGLDWDLDPRSMEEPRALLTRLNRIGNNSDTARKHKQVLRCQYPHWQWDDLLDTFQLSPIIEALDEVILPPPFDKLPALIKYITHESNTYFLDYTTQDWPPHIMWNRFNLDWLSDDWQVALPILDQVDNLCSWLIKNPEQLEKVWTVLSVTHKRIQI